MDDQQPLMPSEVDAHVGVFDRFAERCSAFVGRAPFFVCCVAMVVLWVPTLAFLPVDLSQLLINTATTIITFLLVGLAANAARRSDQAGQRKLNAIAKADAAWMTAVADKLGIDMDDHIRELRAAVGLENRESS